MQVARTFGKAQRRCLACGYEGQMKTWLANYNFPQFLLIILLLFWIIPGLIFLAWGWKKYKCPKCGALAKNVSIEFKQSSSQHSTSGDEWKHLTDEKTCPYCAETIKKEAKLCRFCGKEIIGIEDNK